MGPSAPGLLPDSWREMEELRMLDKALHDQSLCTDSNQAESTSTVAMATQLLIWWTRRLQYCISSNRLLSSWNFWLEIRLPFLLGFFLCLQLPDFYAVTNTITDILDFKQFHYFTTHVNPNKPYAMYYFMLSDPKPHSHAAFRVLTLLWKWIYLFIHFSIFIFHSTKLHDCDQNTTVERSVTLIGTKPKTPSSLFFYPC